MAYTSIQSAIYSKILAAYIQKQLVFKNACNFTWEAEAKRNKTVFINRIGKITVGTYDTATGLSGSLNDIATSTGSLSLNQYKFANVKIDDVLAATTNINLVQPTLQAMAYEMANTQDAYVATLESSATGQLTGSYFSSSFRVVNGATESSVSASAYDLAVNIKVQLDTQYAPQQDRFLLAPSWFVQSAAKDVRFAYFDPAVRAQGIIGNIAGLTVLQTENCYVDANGVTHIMGLHNSAIGFASGLETVEILRSQDYFANLLRSLAVYGALMVEPSRAVTMLVKA